MPQPPDWKRYLEAGMQVTEFRRSQARALAGDLVSTGQLARDQVATAVDEMIAMSRRRTEQLQGIVRAEVQRQLGALGLATRADLRHLEQRLNATVKKSAKQAAKRAAKATNATNAKAAKKAAAKKAG
jgi:polyhydroxyalkanoate synthesis regulator phasin